MLKISFQCPHCKKRIRGWLSTFAYGNEPRNEEQPILLDILVADSCGAYGAVIECPKCGEETDVWS